MGYQTQKILELNQEEQRPIGVIRGAILINDSGQRFFQLKLKNNLPYTLQQLQVQIVCYNEDGMYIGAQNYTYQSLSVEPGEVFGTKQAIPVEFESTDSFSVMGEEPREESEEDAVGELKDIWEEEQSSKRPEREEKRPVPDRGRGPLDWPKIVGISLFLLLVTGIFGGGGEQVVYGDSAYIVAQQEVNGAVHSVLLRARLDGSVETVVDLAEGFYHVFRNGNQIVIDLLRNNKYEYYYITPDDYTLRSYEGERPMAGGSAVYFDHEGTPESLGYYSADDYRVEDGNTIVTLDENGNMKQADRLFSSTGGSIGKITVMWGNDAYTLIRITWENPNSLFAELSQVTKTYKLTVGGGAVEELNGNVYIYEGNVYYRAPEALYRWDYQGNATKLMDRPGTLYFQNGYVFSRDGYNIVGIKL